MNDFLHSLKDRMIDQWKTREIWHRRDIGPAYPCPSLNKVRAAGWLQTIPSVGIELKSLLLSKRIHLPYTSHFGTLLIKPSNFSIFHQATNRRETF